MGDGVMVAVGKAVAVAVGDGYAVAVGRRVGDGSGNGVAVSVAVAGMVAMAACVGSDEAMACVRGVHALMSMMMRGKTAVNAIFPLLKLTILKNCRGSSQTTPCVSS